MPITRSTHCKPFQCIRGYNGEGKVLLTAESKSNSKALLIADEYQRDDAVLLQTLLFVLAGEFHSRQLGSKTKQNKKRTSKKKEKKNWPNGLSFIGILLLILRVKSTLLFSFGSAFAFALLCFASLSLSLSLDLYFRMLLNQLVTDRYSTVITAPNPQLMGREEFSPSASIVHSTFLSRFNSLYASLAETLRVLLQINSIS